LVVDALGVLPDVVVGGFLVGLIALDKGPKRSIVDRAWISAASREPLPHFLPEDATALCQLIKFDNAVEIAVQTDRAGQIAQCAGFFTGNPIGLAVWASLSDFKSGSV
jgi:hypothetical protein